MQGKGTYLEELVLVLDRQNFHRSSRAVYNPDTVSVPVIITTNDGTVCDLWVLGPVLATEGHKRNSTCLFLQAGLPPPGSCEVLNCGDG